MNIHDEKLNHPLLAPHAARLRQSALPSVPFTLREESCPAWASKVGGRPYRLQGAPWPQNAAGQSGDFLAQINLAEMPPLPDFPRQGLLQFFVGDWGHKEEAPFASHVHYLPEIVEDEALLSQEAPASHDESLMPFEEGFEARMVFQAPEQQIATLDEWEMLDLPEWEDDEWDEAYELLESEDDEIHRVGGYAVYAQDVNRARPDDVLLLQLVSSFNEKWDLCWGDAGTGHFFIPRADLQAKRFERAYFYADCH